MQPDQATAKAPLRAVVADLVAALVLLPEEAAIRTEPVAATMVAVEQAVEQELHIITVELEQ